MPLFEMRSVLTKLCVRVLDFTSGPFNSGLERLRDVLLSAYPFPFVGALLIEVLALVHVVERVVRSRLGGLRWNMSFPSRELGR